ncbi:hypothetical protein OPQ81_011173 [Rhizoctonia solani]|nr:hypothetical protein OPQ81_011173 [Rhizoctonia solani]
MSAPSHPYSNLIESHPSDSDCLQSFINLDSESKLAGLQAVWKISQLAIERQLPRHPESNPGVDVPTLVSALRLSLDISTLNHLSSPAVINGCLWLIKAATGQRPTPTSPFSHEYERMCFRLLVVSLNLCLLEQWNKLDSIQEVPNLIPPHQAAYAILETHVATEVLNQLDLSAMGEDCDWVFGWSTSIHHHHQTLLLPKSDVLFLVNLLWEDRKHWLRYMTSYANPGLSGLMFLFSRYVAYERHSQTNQALEPLRDRVLELVLRYTLVADKYQLPATCAIADANAHYQDTD